MPKVEPITEAKRIEEYIYNRLEYAIAFLGINQTDAGRAIGITQSGFSQAFNGKTLTIRQFCQLLDELGLDLCIESK